MKKLMIMLAATATTAALCAQEAGASAPAATSAPAAAAPAAAPAATDTTLVVAAQAADDGGAQIIAIAEEKAAEVAALPNEPATSALDKVNTDLGELGFTDGYDEAKKAIIQIGVANMEIADPAKDPAFMTKREQIGNFALLQAKAEVIRAINSQFSAMDRALTQFDESIEAGREAFYAARDAVEAKRAELVAVLAKLDATDANAVAEVTLNDRFGSFIDAVIKKIDDSYDANAIAAKKKVSEDAARAEAEALKAKVAELSAEYKKLEAEAAKFPKEPALETETTASLLSKMPLLGSSVLTQAESWDPSTKQYSVAVAIVWSPKLQELAFKMGTGDFSALSKPGKFSKLEWVKAQDWSSMIGTRQFTDNKGHKYFVGIGAVDPGLGVQANAKRMIAETLARKNVAMSLIGDLEANREMKQNLKVFADNSTATQQKIVDAISSKVDLQLKGCLSLAKKEVKHPITGKKIYVCAYYIDPALAKDANKALKDAFAKAGLVARATSRERGFVAGAQAAYDATKNNAADRQAGMAAGAAAVNAAAAESQKKAVTVKKTARKTTVTTQVVRPAEAPAKSKGGTFSGGTIDTDF